MSIKLSDTYSDLSWAEEIDRQLVEKIFGYQDRFYEEEKNMNEGEKNTINSVMFVLGEFFVVASDGYYEDALKAVSTAEKELEGIENKSNYTVDLLNDVKKLKGKLHELTKKE